MKTRIVLHKAFNKHGASFVLVEVSGKFIPLSYKAFHPSNINRAALEWLNIGFFTFNSVAQWKRFARLEGAHRFERVILLGDTE